MKKNSARQPRMIEVVEDVAVATVEKSAKSKKATTKPAKAAKSKPAPMDATKAPTDAPQPQPPTPPAEPNARVAKSGANERRSEA